MNQQSTLQTNPTRSAERASLVSAPKLHWRGFTASDCYGEVRGRMQLDQVVARLLRAKQPGAPALNGDLDTLHAYLAFGTDCGGGPSRTGVWKGTALNDYNFLASCIVTRRDVCADAEFVSRLRKQLEFGAFRAAPWINAMLETCPEEYRVEVRERWRRFSPIVRDYFDQIAPSDSGSSWQRRLPVIQPVNHNTEPTLRKLDAICDKMLTLLNSRDPHDLFLNDPITRLFFVQACLQIMFLRTGNFGEESQIPGGVDMIRQLRAELRNQRVRIDNL